MASIVSLLSDHKTVYHVDDQGNRSELSLVSTHGVNFSLNGSEIEAENATSAATGSLEASVDVSTKEWTLNYYAGGSTKVLHLIGIDSVDLGIQMDQRTVDLTSGDYNLKRVSNNIEIRKVS